MNDGIHRQWGQLLQAMRNAKGDHVALEDLIASLEGLLSATPAKDVAVRQEVQHLLHHIASTRAAAREWALDAKRGAELAEASDTLELIVQSTEEATDRILDAAEAIMAVAGEHPHSETIAAACLSIMEACNFQDLNGQRIQKVLSTLCFLEERLQQLSAFLDGGAPLPAPQSRPPEPALEGRAAEDAAGLLNGPQGEKPSQEDIDALFKSLDE